MALLPLTVSAQNDNIQRPPKKTVQQTPPKRTQPAKPARQITQQSTPSHALPVDSAKIPQDTATNHHQLTSPVQQMNLQTITQVLTPPAEPEVVKPMTGFVNGHEWVDLGLSVKWATMNVGASSPSDYGGYYAWGETSTKSRYEYSNCFDCLDPSGDYWRTYKLGGQTKIIPASGHDTARENWGGTWRMPTDAEYEELCKKCRWTWTSQGGHNGYEITGPNGSSIFLPAAGYRSEARTYDVGKYSFYWSSTLSSSYSGYAYFLYFSSSGRLMYDRGRSAGQSVRPVTD